MNTDSSQRNILIGLIVAAIVVFGAFVLLNLSDRPLNPPAATEAVEPAADTSGATAQTDEADATLETTPPAESSDSVEATEAAGAASTDAPQAETTAESTGQDEGNPTPTSASRVRDSILIGTQTTPVLQPSQPAGSNTDGENATPTSVSRVDTSIRIGAQTTPVLQGDADSAETDDTAGDTSQADGDTQASGSTDSEGDANATPTSQSRVTQSVLIGAQTTPVLRSTQPAGLSGGENATPTSVSRVASSILLEAPEPGDETPAEPDAEATADAEQTQEAAANAERTAAPQATAESTEASAVAAAGGGALPSPVPGRANGSPSALSPVGPVAARQADLFWLMVGIGAAVYVFVLGLVGIIVFNRRRTANRPPSERENRLFVIGGGVVFPIVVLTLLFALTVNTLSVLAVANQPTYLTVQIIGYRWWWEVRYPDHDIVTANEIHIPAGQPVRFELMSEDVIHSFWVPQLGGKMDLIPGRSNNLWLEAAEPGIYRGQCAEYCGLQHAKMALLVVADSPADFDAWVAQQQQPAREPDAALVVQGRDVFMNAQCIGCHTVRGADAAGQQGPDLTHFGSRLTIGAATVPNTAGHLGGWIVDSQGIKPGNLMPPQDVSGSDLQALIAYLGSLQ